MLETLSMSNGGWIFGIPFLNLVELTKEYFVLEIFQDSLLALSQVATFRSSSSIISKTFSLLESEINKLVSYANIIGVKLIYMYEQQKWSKDGALW